MYRGIYRVQHPACEALHPQVLCPKEVRAVHVLACGTYHWHIQSCICGCRQRVMNVSTDIFIVFMFGSAT